jgi:hypothetical protein
MKTKTINLYTAAELKERFPQAFERARLDYVKDFTGSDYADAAITDFLRIARMMGFQIDLKGIAWTGFGSQGDGASFTGSAAFDPDALAKVKAYAPVDEKLHAIAAECEQYGKEGIHARLERISRHYSHEHTVTADAWHTDSDGEEMNLDDIVTDFPVTCTEIQKTCRAFMRWLYGQLEKEYEYRSGDECFLETATANDWHFTEAGELE